MESSGTGVELQVGCAVDTLRAIPDAGTAIDAFLAIERGCVVLAAGNGLARAHLDAEHRTALAAGFEVAEDYVIGVAGGRLHFAAHEKRVLMRDEQRAVMDDFRPPGAGHQLVVKGDTAAFTFFANQFDIFRAEFSAIELLRSFQLLRRVGASEREASVAESAQRHADQAGDDATMKAIA